MSFTHGEVGSRASVVEYESYVFGFALVIVGIVDRCRDVESSVGSILDERRPGVGVVTGVVDDVLVCTSYYDRGCG